MINPKATLTDNDFSNIRGLAISIIKNIGIPWWYMDFDDLISEGYLGYLSAVKSFNSQKGAGFTHWAYIKMRGNILSYLCRKSPQDYLELNDDCCYRFKNPQEETSLNIIDLKNEIKKLPQRTQEILWRYYWERMTIREIGTLYELSPTGVEAVLQRALRQLKTELYWKPMDYD